MILIVDAYNVIHAVPALEAELERGLRHAREHLVRLAEEILGKRGDIQEIVLVFDGDSRYGHADARAARGIKTVFTESDESADERIVSILGAVEDRRRMAVVSGDNFVINHARAYGTNCMSVREFFALSLPAPKGPSVKEGIRKRGLSAEDERSITEDYKKDLGLT
jgi:predicted RNA-binding protein with PIN domain